jgi:hypothetical protein
VPHCSNYVWWYGVQCRGVDGRPGESRFRRASWRALYSSRSSFEGGGVGASRLVVVHTLTQACSCREVVRCIAAGVVASCRPVLPQRQGWCCSARDGVVVAGMAAQG